MTTMQTVLIIDDEKDIRGALHTALHAAGFNVLEAKDGAVGLEMARTHDPDLILLDINMPHVSGHGVLRELRQNPSPKNPHILLLTNNDDATNITRGVTLRSDDYIMKSQTSLSDIVKRVKQHLAGYYDRS